MPKKKSTMLPGSWGLKNALGVKYKDRNIDDWEDRRQNRLLAELQEKQRAKKQKKKRSGSKKKQRKKRRG